MTRYFPQTQPGPWRDERHGPEWLLPKNPAVFFEWLHYTVRKFGSSKKTSRFGKSGASACDGSVLSPRPSRTTEGEIIDLSFALRAYAEGVFQRSPGLPDF